MKSTKRQATTAAGILALSLMSTVGYAQGPAQHGGPPGPDTPAILVTAFHSPDPKLGTDMANELRSRLQDEHAAKELYVTPKMNIDNTLIASGYKPDSALNASDVMELAKQLRAEFVVDGVVTRAGAGVHLAARLLTKTGTQTLSQPLPPVDGKDAGDAAKMTERSITEVLKGMASYKLCTNDLRAAKYDQAMKDARIGITTYPNSTLNRICLLNAYTNNKAPADSVIGLANAILAIDPTSMLALLNLADAYAQKGDNDKAIQTNLRIYAADPSNTAVVTSIVNSLGNSGAPGEALPIIDSLLKDNPADPSFLRTKWLLQLKAGHFKDAIATGEELVKIDTSMATVDYYNRQIGAAQKDSNIAAVQRLAGKAALKFTKDISFPLLLAQSYYKGGQFPQSYQAARHATGIDPKNMDAWQFALAAANAMNQSDTVSALAKQAMAAGVDKTVIGGYLLGPTAAAFKKAQETKSRDDWKAAFAAASSVDSIAPTPQSKFYVGVTSFSLAQDYANEIQTLAKSSKKADKEQACVDAKMAEDLLATTSMAMPAGGSVDKNVASQILGAVGQYGEYIPQAKKAFCKP